MNTQRHIRTILNFRPDNVLHWSCSRSVDSLQTIVKPRTNSPISSLWPRATWGLCLLPLVMIVKPASRGSSSARRRSFSIKRIARRRAEHTSLRSIDKKGEQLRQRSSTLHMGERKRKGPTFCVLDLLAHFFEQFEYRRFAIRTLRGHDEISADGEGATTKHRENLHFCKIPEKPRLMIHDARFSKC